MRTVILLLLCFALLLTGCPDSTPADPALQDAPAADNSVAPAATSELDGPTLEVTDIPSSHIEPRLDEIEGIRHAAAFEGDVALEGSGVTGGGREANPFLVQIPASAGDLVQVHLRGTFEGGGGGTLTAQVAVPGYNTIITVPATDAWVYKAFYMPISGTLDIRFYNGASYEGPLNVDAASLSYYAKNVPTPFADEPNADNNAATVSDRSIASPIAQDTLATRGLVQVADGPVDTEEWYALDMIEGGPNLRVTFDVYGHRYGAWHYELTFFDETGVQIGLKTIIRSPGSAKLFSLRGVRTWAALEGEVYLRVVAKPLATALTTNAAYAIHSLKTESPLAIYPIADMLVPPLSLVQIQENYGGGTYEDSEFHWDFGAGAACSIWCNLAIPQIITGAPGRYKGSVWMQDAEEVSETVAFTYESTCHRWPSFSAAWNAADHPGVVWEDFPLPRGTLISSGGKPYAITADDAGDVRSMDLWHRLGSWDQPQAEHLAAVPHAGRVYIVYLESGSNHLKLWVSSDAVPNQVSDWKQITLDERTLADRPIQMASSGNRLAVLYSTGPGGGDLRLAYSKNQLADRQLDWGTGLVQNEFIPRTQTLTSHANRWWTAQREPGNGRILISASRDLAPYSDSHWNAHTLIAATLDEERANISLMPVEGRLTAIYAIPVATWYDFRMAQSTVAVPQTTSDWVTASIIPPNPVGYPIYEMPSESGHVVTLLDNNFVFGFQSSGSGSLWRSCDLSPQSHRDWSRGYIPGVIPQGDYPSNLLGLTAPGGDYMYALYLDNSPNGEVMRLHQLRLDFW